MLIVCSLLAVVILAVGGFILFDRIRHGSFYQDAAREFVIPGLGDNFTPQGFDYLEEQDLFICCGYMSDGTPSRIYTVDKAYHASSPVRIQSKDGSDHTGHASGITVFAATDHVYLASEGCLHLLSLADILDGDGVATIREDLNVMLASDYCTIYNGYLLTGSYYYPEAYETPAHERMLTPTGEQNYALMALYRLDPETGLLASDEPEKLISTPGMIQGMAVIDENTFVLSASWGFSSSRLLIYDVSGSLVPGSQGGDSEYELESGNRIPLFYLDSNRLLHTISAPAMSEELVVRDGRIYVMNEAASNKYFFGKLLGAQRLYSYPIPENEEP